MENQLSVIVKESGLEKTKAQVLLDNFSTYFQIAGEWEKKAKTIVVTDASQEAEMKMARVGRLFLRQKRIAIEHTRKELKEQSLRESKAIDGIANVLKALIIPVEEYLEKQERYVEIKAAEEARRKQIEAEKKAEEEQLAKEKAEAEERERIRKENERLKKEAEERERKMAEERAGAEREKKALEEKAKKEREVAAKAVIKEQERRERDLAAERAKAEKERIEAEEKNRIEAEKKQHIYEEKVKKEQKAKEEAERKIQIEREGAEERLRVELEKAEVEKAAYKTNVITCPFCHKTFKLEQAATDIDTKRL